VGHVQNVFGSNVSSLSLVEERFITWHQPPLEFLTLNVEGGVVSEFLITVLVDFAVLLEIIMRFSCIGSLVMAIYGVIIFLLIKVCFYVGCWDPRILFIIETRSHHSIFSWFMILQMFIVSMGTWFVQSWSKYWGIIMWPCVILQCNIVILQCDIFVGYGLYKMFLRCKFSWDFSFLTQSSIWWWWWDYSQLLWPFQ